MTTFAMPGNLKVAIIGPASFHPLVDVALYVRGLPKTTTILSGGDSPLDTIVVKTANEQGLALVEYPADWDTYGNHAEFIRDDKLITACDRLVAFWDGYITYSRNHRTTSTLRNIQLAVQQGKFILIIPQARHKETS